MIDTGAYFLCNRLPKNSKPLFRLSTANPHIVLILDTVIAKSRISAKSQDS